MVTDCDMFSDINTEESHRNNEKKKGFKLTCDILFISLPPQSVASPLIYSTVFKKNGNKFNIIFI